MIGAHAIARPLARRAIVPAALLLGGAIGLTGCGRTPVSTAAPGAPAAARRPAAAGQAVFDLTHQSLGDVPTGESKETRFPVRNVGAAPLTLLEVTGGCGCLTVDHPTTLPPGASGQVVVRFQPQPTWQGPMTKTIRVRTDDPRQPEVSLSVHANVVPYVRLDPPSPVTVRYRPGQTIERVVRLIPREGLAIRFDPPVSDHPLVRARLEPPTGRSRVYRLHLTMGPLPAPGDLMARIDLNCSDARIGSVPVVVSALAEEGPVIFPRRLVIPILRASEAGRSIGRIQVLTRSGRLQLLEAVSEAPELELRPRAVREGGFYEVDVRYRGGWRPGAVQTKIRLRLDHPALPTFEVPVNVGVQP